MTTTIPAGMQSKFFCEWQSDTAPAIWRESTMIFIPVFVRQETVEEKTTYRFFVVPVAYTGQDLEDYEKCVMQSYASIRKYFYGDAAAQGEMRDDHTWEAHRQAIRTAFPKYEGEQNTAQARFDAIKTAFWGYINEALAEIEKTRADLPAYFDAETMLEFAAANGMSAEGIADYTNKFATVSLDLLHNDRNWKELFA